MSKLVKSVLLLILITLISKILGFSRELILAYKFGASAITDAYIIAQAIPLLILGGFINMLAVGYIPIYTDARQGNLENAEKFTSNLMTVIFLISIGLITIYLALGDFLIRLLAPGFDQATFELAVLFSNVMIFSLVFTAVTSIISGFLHYKEKFAIVNISNLIIVNIFIIIAVLLADGRRPYILAFGFIVGGAVAAIVMVASAIKCGFRYKPIINFKDTSLKAALKISVPIFLASLAGQINAMVDRSLASTLPVGTLSSLNYANRLILLIMGLFVMSTSTVIFPRMNKYVVENDINSIKVLVSKSLIILSMIIIPITVGMIVLAEPLINILFQRGAFVSDHTIVTAQSLVFYSIGLIFMAYREILTKLFIALKMTKVITINSIVVVSVNILLNLILINLLQHKGLALATSIASIISVFLLFKSLRNRIGDWGENIVIRNILQMLIASSIMCLGVSYSFNSVNSLIGSTFGGLITSLITSIVLGSIIYFLLLYTFNIGQFRFICKRFIEFIRQRKKKITNKVEII